MYLLDTNHCSRIIFGDSNLIQQLQAHSDAGIATSVVVCGELLYMAAKSDRSVANLQQVRVFLDTIDIYPINLSISEVYGNLKGKLVNAFGPRGTLSGKNCDSLLVRSLSRNINSRNNSAMHSRIVDNIAIAGKFTFQYFF